VTGGANVFYSSKEWESGYSSRVAGGGSVDLILRFWLERGCDGTKHYQKMKRSQRARLGFMGRKCGMLQWRDDIGWRRGGSGEGKGRRRCHLDWRESYYAKK
jgi:hypothetical protein